VASYRVRPMPWRGSVGLVHPPLGKAGSMSLMVIFDRLAVIRLPDHVCFGPKAT